jgi:glycosyltransferase involved in cell wall biosynthesis
MTGVEATVIVPTSIDRGPLLQYSVGSVLAQTVRALEVFIIGDGVQDLTREAAHALARQDSRVRFFDHPKGSRRGETYRHQALQEARGAIVCYLCDRDLWLPDHLATMRELLTNADFGTTLPLDVRVDGTIRTPMSSHLDLGRVDDRQHVLRERLGFQLSVVGHTLDMYRRLPYGWRITPEGLFTDAYMWWQFLEDPICRARSNFYPTVLYFARGGHPGLSTGERLRELALWSSRMQEQQPLVPCLRDAYGEAVKQKGHLDRRLRLPLLVRSFTPAELFRLAMRKVSSRGGRRPIP